MGRKPPKSGIPFYGSKINKNKFWSVPKDSDKYQREQYQKISYYDNYEKSNLFLEYFKTIRLKTMN